MIVWTFLAIIGVWLWAIYAMCFTEQPTRGVGVFILIISVPFIIGIVMFLVNYT